LTDETDVACDDIEQTYFFQWPQPVEDYVNSLEHLGVLGIRCAALTLQLAILNAVKKQDQNLFRKVRSLSVLLRKQIMRDILRGHGLPIPSLDGVTRWSSLLKMIEDVLLIKEKSPGTIASCKSTVCITEEEWDKLQKMRDSLLPAKIATKILQTEQLTVGDFFSALLRCKLNTAAIGTSLATDIVAAMERREQILFFVICDCGRTIPGPSLPSHVVGGSKRPGTLSFGRALPEDARPHKRQPHRPGHATNPPQ